MSRNDFTPTSVRPRSNNLITGLQEEAKRTLLPISAHTIVLKPSILAQILDSLSKLKPKSFKSFWFGNQPVMKSIIRRNTYLYRPSDIISKESISLNVQPARGILEYHNLHYNACIITILGLGTIHIHHNCSSELKNRAIRLIKTGWILDGLSKAGFQFDGKRSD